MPIGLGAATLAAGAMGLAGSLANVGSTIGTNRQMLQNYEMARKLQIELANRQNEYNSPVQQVSRLVRAGLNPNTAFGGSSTPAASAGDMTPPSLQAPQVDMSSMMNAFLGVATQKEMQNSELEYKYAVLRENARQFNITEGLSGSGATSRAKAAQAALQEQQKQFNDADRAIQIATSKERLNSLKLDNSYKSKANELELNYKEWRNAFEQQKGSYELTKAKLDNIILGNQKHMSDIDAKLYATISGYKAEILKAGVEEARLNNILLETDKVKRDAEIAKLKTDLALQEQTLEARGVHVPWLDYTLDILGSVVSMASSIKSLTGNKVNTISIVNN